MIICCDDRAQIPDSSTTLHLCIKETVLNTPSNGYHTNIFKVPWFLDVHFSFRDITFFLYINTKRDDV